MLLSQDLQRVVEAETKPAEKILWVGQPDPMRMVLQPSNFAVFGFGVIWTSFIVNFQHLWAKGAGSYSTRFWGFNGIASDLFMVPFFVIGISLLLTPAWGYLTARRMVYAITTDGGFDVSFGSSVGGGAK